MMKTENEINIKQLDKVTGGTDPELISFTSPSVLALEPDEPEWIVIPTEPEPQPDKPEGSVSQNIKIPHISIGDPLLRPTFL